MISLVLLILQLFTLGLSQPGPLIPQVLQGRGDVTPGQNQAADIVNQRPSSAPSIVLPPPGQTTGTQGQGTSPGQTTGTPSQGTTPEPAPGIPQLSQTGSLISQVLQARNDIPPGQNFAADIVNKRPSIAPSIVLPSPSGQVTPPGQSPGGQGQGTSPGQSPDQGTPPGQSPDQGIPPGQSPNQGTPPGQSPTTSPVIIGRPAVPASPRRTPTPDPNVVVVAPKPVVVVRDVAPVRVVKQVQPPVASKKSTHGITLVVVPDGKCIKLEDILKDPQFSILAKALEVAKLEQPNKKVLPCCRRCSITLQALFDVCRIRWARVGSGLWWLLFVIRGWVLGLGLF